MAPRQPDDACFRLVDLCTENLRVPSSFWTESTTGDPVLVFEPALSVGEQATLADLTAMARNHITGLSLAEYQALKPKLVEIRAFRTRSLAQWNALTATNREADEIAYLNDLTDVLRALLRD